MAEKELLQAEFKLERIPWMDRLLADVKHFKLETGMEYSTIGMKAIGNGRVYDRLLKDGDIGVRNADQLYFWMAVKGFNFKS